MECLLPIVWFPLGEFGMVVEIRPEDYSELMKHEEMAVSKDSPLALMAFQERLEELLLAERRDEANRPCTADG